MGNFKLVDASGSTVGHAYDSATQGLALIATAVLFVVFAVVVAIWWGLATYWAWATSVFTISPYHNFNGLLVTGGLYLGLSVAYLAVDTVARKVWGLPVKAMAIFGLGWAWVFAMIVAGGAIVAAPVMVAIRWLFHSSTSTHRLLPWQGDFLPDSLVYPYLAPAAGLIGAACYVYMARRSDDWGGPDSMVERRPVLLMALATLAPFVGMVLARSLGWAPMDVESFRGAVSIHTISEPRGIGDWNFIGTLLGGMIIGALVIPWLYRSPAKKT